jgi:hypothetical protein
MLAVHFIVGTGAGKGMRIKSEALWRSPNLKHFGGAVPQKGDWIE